VSGSTRTPLTVATRGQALRLAVVGAVALAGCALAGALYPAVPLVHDEFSYLLAAKTMAAGRLANPPHPMWQHFETMHVLQQPTYASKYPPGQGAALAVGIWLAGRPIVGAWLSVTLACVALTWMLEAWLPRPWPLVGGLLAAVQPEIVYAWGNTFWGGAVAMAGGALVWGALPRVRRRALWRDGALLGAGLGLLAITRPLEGAMAAAPVVLALPVILVRRPRSGRVAMLRSTLVPLVLGLLAFACLTAAHDRAVTGDATVVPYMEHNRQYEIAPFFMMQPLRDPPVYRHDALRRFYLDNATSEWREARRPGGLLHTLARALGTYAGFYGRWSFGALLLVLPLALRCRRLRLPAAALALFLLVLLAETFNAPHYAAPMAGVFFLLLTSCARELWLRRRFALRVLVVALLIGGTLEHGLAARALARGRATHVLGTHARIQEALEARGGKHLIVVRYAPDHDPHLEWVYNEPDIDAAPVVWAREMDPASNARLLAYFADRKAWLYEPERAVMRLTPYRPAGLHDAPGGERGGGGG
jgi:hypothetical protein